MGAFGLALPPDVVGQMPSMSQFAGGGAPSQPPMGGPGEATQDPNALVNQSLDAIVQQLAQVATVLQQTRPELVVFIQKMAEAGSQLQSSLAGPPAGEGEGEMADPAGPPKAKGPGDVPLA